MKTQKPTAEQKPAAKIIDTRTPGQPHDRTKYHGPAGQPAAPQSSPLTWIVVETRARIEIDTRKGWTIALPHSVKEDAALIVRRVNQGPAFDAMLDVLPWLIARHPAPCGFTITTNSQDPYTCGKDSRLCPTCQRIEKARAALKLAQEVR